MDSIDMLHSIVYYENSSECDIKLMGANSQPLQITAKGFFQDMVQPFYVVSNLDENLFSTINSRLGLWTALPDQSVYIDDKLMHGFLYHTLHLDLMQYSAEKLQHLSVTEIILATFRRPIETFYFYTSKSQVHDTMNSAKVNCDEPSITIESPPTESINSTKIYGVEMKSIKELVIWLQETFLCSKDKLIDTCSLMSNFPVNEKEVRKHHNKLQVYRDGQKRMRNTPFRKTAQDLTESDDNDVNQFKNLE
jgi:hypothetical protein